MAIAGASPVNCADFEEDLMAAYRDPRSGAMARLQVEDDLVTCIVARLRESAAAGDWWTFNAFLVAATKLPSREYTRVICVALDGPELAVNLEDAVEILGDSADPAAVDCLRRLVGSDLEGVDERSLGFKLAWALERIGTEDAFDALAVLAHDSPSPEAREVAARAFERRGVQERFPDGQAAR
jgi:hypothetical protein